LEVVSRCSGVENVSWTPLAELVELRSTKPDVARRTSATAQQNMLCLDSIAGTLACLILIIA
jgi:hypothetical protein